MQHECINFTMFGVPCPAAGRGRSKEGGSKSPPPAPAFADAYPGPRRREVQQQAKNMSGEELENAIMDALEKGHQGGRKDLDTALKALGYAAGSAGIAAGIGQLEKVIGRNMGRGRSRANRPTFGGLFFDAADQLSRKLGQTQKRKLRQPSRRLTTTAQEASSWPFSGWSFEPGWYYALPQGKGGWHTLHTPDTWGTRVIPWDPGYEYYESAEDLQAALHPRYFKGALTFDPRDGKFYHDNGDQYYGYIDPANPIAD